MNFSDEESSNDSIQHLLTVTPSKSINEEEMHLETRDAESIDDEVMWIMTCIPSENEKEVIKKEEIESKERIVSPEKTIKDNEMKFESKSAFGPHDRDVCLSMITSYVEMLKQNKKNKRDWSTTDEKWYRINCSNLKKAKNFVENYINSGEKVSTLLKC
jgi:hypothetical protein